MFPVSAERNFVFKRSVPSTKNMSETPVGQVNSCIYLVTNHATDAINTVVHTVNMKFRKLTRNRPNARNTNKT